MKNSHSRKIVLAAVVAASICVNAEPAADVAAASNILADIAAPAPAPAAAKAEVKPEAKPEVKPEAKPEVKELPAKSTDEINLDEVDDAALADRAPTVRKTLPSATAAAVSSDGAELADDESALVDIACDDATLADILRQFRKTIGANIISGDSSNLQQRVSVNLHRVPWMQSLQSILNTRGFRLEPRDGIYFVAEDRQVIPTFTRTYKINHASAEELAKMFNDTYSVKTPDGKSYVKPVATPFPGANVVVVTASEKILADCEAIIRAVDNAVAQIYIEARFIELSNEALHKLGMDWSQLSSWGASVKNVGGGVEYNNGRTANYGTFLSKNTMTSTSTTSKDGNTQNDNRTTEHVGMVPGTINPAPGASRTADNMSWHNARGFQGQLSVDDFRLAMSAFESMTDAKVFSNPKIIVANGREAKVDMTRKYPNVKIDSDFTGQNQNSLSVSTSLEVIPGEDKLMFAKEAFFSWGITLSVKPRISPDGLISVEIVPTISDCSDYATVQSSKESDTPYSKYPIIDVQRLTTEFTMKDGATAVIGGLSQTKEEDVDSGIPYLRDIPWVGQKIFGWTSRQKVQKEIIVFVTIGIANPSELKKDIGLPKNAVLGREYVEGRALEPGDRPEMVDGVSQLDKRSFKERRNDKLAAKGTSAAASSGGSGGTVVITPVKAVKSADENK